MALIDEMNMAIEPLIGASGRVADLHKCMAEMSNELHTIIGSYKGTFESIWADPHTKFNPTVHILDKTRLGPGKVIIKGDILITTCFGVGYKAPRKDWRVCAPAKVILAPPPNTTISSPKRKRDDTSTFWKNRARQTINVGNCQARAVRCTDDA